jgi:hypothetical protein
LLAISPPAAFAQTASKSPLPDFRAVTAAVDSYFESFDHHLATDLISRSQIDGALRSVEAVGWNVPNAEKIAELGLADDSFVIRELSTPAGRKFMRKIASHPGTYGRLDRLSAIPRGEAMIRDLVRMPGGDELIIYLASTSGGQKMGRSMAGVGQGVDLNKPTGRIYTATELMDVLQRVYQWEASKR